LKNPFKRGKVVLRGIDEARAGEAPPNPSIPAEFLSYSMEVSMKDLKSLTEAIRWFGDSQHCIDAVTMMRWPEGKPICMFCGGEKHCWLEKQGRWKCAKFRKQFSVKLGTVFEDSAIVLDRWLCG
jgi:hypothetical protein